jgi:hypothetical protein
MNRFVGMVGIVFAGLGAGCSSSEMSPPVGPPLGPSVPMVRLRSEPYSFTYYSGLDTPARLVLRDAGSWQEVWSQIYSRQSPAPPLPAVDFSHEMIVVVALGSHGTGGYQILLTNASEVGNNGTAITVSSTSPGPSCIVTEAFTQPVDIARVPVRDGAVTFVEQSHVSSCN